MKSSQSGSGMAAAYGHLAWQFAYKFCSRTEKAFVEWPREGGGNCLQTMKSEELRNLANLISDLLRALDEKDC